MHSMAGSPGWVHHVTEADAVHLPPIFRKMGHNSELIPFLITEGGPLITDLPLYALMVILLVVMTLALHCLAAFGAVSIVPFKPRYGELLYYQQMVEAKKSWRIKLFFLRGFILLRSGLC